MADVEQVARDVVGAGDPVVALGLAAAALSAAELVHVVESVFHRLPAFADPTMLRAAAAAHAVLGEADAALLLDGLARQMERTGVAPANAAPTDAAPRGGAPPSAVAVLTAADPQARLRVELEVPGLAPDAAVGLILAVWGRLAPVTDYWIARRATEFLEANHRETGAMVMAGFALQLVPGQRRSSNPAATLLRGLLRRGRYAAARALAAAWIGPTDIWVAAEPWRGHLAAAARVPPLPPPALRGWSSRTLRPAETRPPMTSLPNGDACPYSLRELRQSSRREPIVLHRLLDAEVIVHGDHIAVFGDDGTPYPELSVGDPPLLVRAAAGSAPGGARRRAVLVADLFPSPNLCHFLCDQTTKLALYADAGVDFGRATVIGARLTRPFQFGIAERFGVSEWLPTDTSLRLRVAELSVVSNCAENHHPAHLGAAWALAAIRAAFPGLGDGNGQRLYLSRSDAAGRRVVNEAELLDALRPAGFQVVSPGALDVADQAALFARASHVVAPHGAGLTNIVFCAPGTRVLELFHPQYGTYAYAVLAQAARLDYRAMVARDASFDGAPPPAAPPGMAWIGRDMRVDVAAVTRWLTAGIHDGVDPSSYTRKGAASEREGTV